MRKLLWGRIAGLAIVAEVLLVLSAVLYMVVYGYLIHPGETDAYYEAYARIASPYVAICAGLPIFFLLSRWLARKAPPRALAHALALWVAVVVLDTGILIGMEGFAGIARILPFWLTSHATKLLGAWLGSRSVAA
jgi:hypothetical protein